jgi:hypothetical protein
MQLKKSANRITVRLVGGLGNQLFGYFAGLELSRAKNAEPVFDVTDIRHKFGVHDVSIETLNLQGNFISQHVSNKLVSSITHKLNRLMKNNKFFSKTYFSNVIGYDKNIYDLPTGAVLNGYFQTYKYFRKIQDSLQPITLKNPSNWFYTMNREIEGSNVLAIHVRRGDYVRLASDYGLLSAIYYKKAIEISQTLNPTKNFWIFSDDIQAAKDLLQRHDSIWVDPSEVVDDAEALILMSKAKSFVIANSTFSWWAAALSGRTSVVIAPEKWYKNMEDPNDLIPPEWISLESNWES